MSSAGRNKEFEKVLEDAQKLIDKSFSFVKMDDVLYCKDDFVCYIETLKLKIKTESGEIVFKDEEFNLQYFPCITKVAQLTDSTLKFPKDKKRNPFECAKIQYMLYNKAEPTAELKTIRDKITNFTCDCKDCYCMMCNGVFREGYLCL